MSARIPVIQRGEYTVFLERFQGKTFVHCDVRAVWTKSIRQRLTAEFGILANLHNAPIYAIHECGGGKKHLKWLALFGFRPIGTAHCLDGQDRDIFVREDHGH